MIKGDIYLTHDPNVLIQQCIIPNTHILFLQDREDIDAQLFTSLGVKPGSVVSALLPDYASFMAQVDEGMESFETKYFAYLQCKAPLQIFMSIISSLCNGHNIILYCPKEHADTFVFQLLKFMGLSFGLIVGLINTGQDRPCSFDLSFTKNVIELLYLFDLYTIEELFLDYPKQEWFSENVIAKLVLDMQPYLKNPNPTLQDYAVYFYNYKEKVKDSNKFLKPMVHR